MSERLPGEFDEDFVTVVGGYDAAMTTEIVKAAESQVAAKVKRTRTYQTSELPVRPCTSGCPLRSRCQDYLKGRVQDNELCRPELRQIKKWQAAFRKGELDRLKDDVGAVAGSLAAQVNRLLEAVNREGVVIEVDRVSASGDFYTEKVTHPALKEAANILKTLGIDMNSFLMTPKSSKDTGPPMQVNIGISLAELNDRYVKRIARTEGPDDS